MLATEPRSMQAVDVHTGASVHVPMQAMPQAGDNSNATTRTAKASDDVSIAQRLGTKPPLRAGAVFRCMLVWMQRLLAHAAALHAEQHCMSGLCSRLTLFYVLKAHHMIS